MLWMIFYTQMHRHLRLLLSLLLRDLHFKIFFSSDISSLEIYFYFVFSKTAPFSVTQASLKHSVFELRILLSQPP